MLESRSAYGYYGAAGGYTGENSRTGNPVRLPYREYMSKWATHKTVPGSYDRTDKTIEVLFTDEEMKQKTNLGNRYCMNSYWFRFDGVEKYVSPIVEFQAKTKENATRNAKRYAMENGYTLVGESSLKEYWDALHR